MESQTDVKKELSPTIDELIAVGLEQKRIDAYIVNEIHKISKNYDDALKKVLARGESNMSNSSNSMDNTQNICNEFKKLIKLILIDLWKDPSPSNFALKCIEKISYFQLNLQKSEEKYDGYPWNTNRLFKMLTQSFYHSRSLMGMESSRQIMKLINTSFKPENYVLQATKKNLRDDNEISIEKIYSFGREFSFFSSNLYIFKYSSEGSKSFTIELFNKTRGGQFGGVFEVMLTEKLTKRYFCKAYWGYPAKSNFNSEKAFASSMSLVLTSDIIDEHPENQYRQLDFKELFVYKVLEFMEIGPKAHFFKVPVLKDGFFIMTEDLSTSNIKFTEIGEMNRLLQSYISIELNRLKNGEIEQSVYKTFHALSGLLELDTINRIFKLHDSNDHNFGYMDTTPSGSGSIKGHKEVAQKWLEQDHEFKIVDFIAPYRSDSYTVDKIFESFLLGNTVTKYLKDNIMDLAISRHFDEDVDETLKRKHKIEKLFFGKQVIESLEKRFFKFGGLEELLSEAKQHIKEFLRENKCDEISDECLEDGLKDIDIYIKGIVENYSNLRKEIYKSSAEVFQPKVTM
jgi:hypothetical protein